jgi:hypothetical protein
MKNIRRVLVLLAVSLASAFAADSIDTVQKLVGFIKSSVQTRQSDRDVAAFLKTVKLKERLDSMTVADLQSSGAGPKTMAALQELCEKTASLPPAAAAAPKAAPKPAPKVGVPPSSEEQAQVLAEIRENAINYTDSLPNYICLRVTERRFDPTGTESWRQADQLQEQLTFFEKQEKYKVLAVNGKMVSKTMEHNKLEGATSEGEFGSLLFGVFTPASETSFEWERWGKWHDHIMFVFAYRVEQSRSRYTILHKDSGRQVVPGYHGLVYADRETKQVMRLTLECDDIPADFPVQDVKLTLEYAPEMIADRLYILPAHSDLHSREGKALVWNETTFRSYRRYSADTTITFEPEPESKPDPKTKKK